MPGLSGLEKRLGKVESMLAVRCQPPPAPPMALCCPATSTKQIVKSSRCVERTS